MATTINKIADISFGLQEKSYENGDALYLQPRHFDSSAMLIQAVDSYINIHTNNQKHLLKDGDILFAGKGVRNFAWCYRSNLGAAIPSASFYVLRPFSDKVYPEYLAIMLNMPENNAFFQQVSSGMTVQSVRKSNLEEFEIHLPDIKTQKQVVEIYALSIRQRKLTEQLIEKRTQLVNALIKKITA